MQIEWFRLNCICFATNKGSLDHTTDVGKAESWIRTNPICLVNFLMCTYNLFFLSPETSLFCYNYERHYNIWNLKYFHCNSSLVNRKCLPAVIGFNNLVNAHNIKITKVPANLYSTMFYPFLRSWVQPSA